ncbi:hypothetical protein DNTS_035031 [Danionella cerebrum]|uniref:Photoreceptor cilium actin regulator n=1 Tax=Danionella cerebrum TaxID=2873325 RepID=A0A553QZY5_9TELE|nr:hypothetical protein DNTS_035031 [Danionella translucida]
MGCSPSKGQLFHRRPESAEIKRNDELLFDREMVQTEEEVTSSGDPEFQEQQILTEETDPDPDEILKEDADVKILDDFHLPDTQTELELPLDSPTDHTAEIQVEEKPSRKRKQRLRRSSHCQAEFARKAHHAACEFLNPNSSRLESVLGLQKQAVQLHLSVEGSVSSALLLYDEIIQALEEMASEGELLLIQHGHYLSWPGPLKDQITKDNSATDKRSGVFKLGEILPELCMFPPGATQQFLCVSGLQELSHCLQNLSEIADQKLLAQHRAEQRLKLVMSQVKAATFGKGLPEDSALYSEDSGIGGENESQNGTDRRIKTRSRSRSIPGSVFPVSISPDEQIHNDDEADDDETDNEEEVTGKESLTDEQVDAGRVPPGVLGRVNRRRIRYSKTVENSLLGNRRPQSCQNIKRSHSLESLISRVRESGPLQGVPKSNQILLWKRKTCSPDDSGAQAKGQKTSSRAQSAERYYGLHYGSKGPFGALPMSSFPTLTPEPRGRNAVKRLINTFSQGSTKHPEQFRSTGNRAIRNCTLPLIHNSRGRLTTTADSSGNSSSVDSHNSFPNKADVDLDSLPPPPPEMLMDNSFEGSVGIEEGNLDPESRVNRLPNSMNRKALLPTGVNMGSGGEGASQEVQEHTQRDSSKPREDITQTCGSLPIGHQRNSAGPLRTESEADTSACNPKNLPPTTPPVSRTRMPPSYPPMHHLVPHPPSTSSTSWAPGGRWTPPVKHGSGSQSYLEARAVFSRGDSAWTPSCASTLPRPWVKMVPASNLSVTSRPVYSDNR